MVVLFLALAIFFGPVLIPILFLIAFTLSAMTIFFLVFSIISTIIFLIIEYIKNIFLNKILNRVISEKTNLIDKITTITNRTFFISKIIISVFGFSWLQAQIVILELKNTIPLFVIIFIPLLIILLLRLTKKRIKLLENIYFLLFPYILSLILFLYMIWSEINAHIAIFA